MRLWHSISLPIKGAQTVNEILLKSKSNQRLEREMVPRRGLEIIDFHHFWALDTVKDTAKFPTMEIKPYFQGGKRSNLARSR